MFTSPQILSCYVYLFLIYTVVANIIVKVLRDAPSLHRMRPHLSSLKDTYTVNLRRVGRSIHDVLRECDINNSILIAKLTGLYCVLRPGVLNNCVVLCVSCNGLGVLRLLCSVLYLYNQFCLGTAGVVLHVSCSGLDVLKCCVVPCVVMDHDMKGV